MTDAALVKGTAKYAARRGRAASRALAKEAAAARGFVSDLQEMQRQVPAFDVPTASSRSRSSWTRPRPGFDAHYTYQGPWVMRDLLARRPESHVDVGSFTMYLGFYSAVVPTTFIDIRPSGLQMRGLVEQAGSVLELPAIPMRLWRRCHACTWSSTSVSADTATRST